MDWTQLTNSLSDLRSLAVQRLDTAGADVLGYSASLAVTASIELRLDGSLTDLLVRDARISLLRDLSDPESDLALCLMVYR